MSTSAISDNSYLSSLYSTSTSSNTSTSKSTSGTSGLGESDFLNLLITQLKNQNPLEPMKDTDFIAQLANFSNLQQMTSVNTNISAMNGAGLIGKQITTSDGLSGTVSQVSIDAGNPSVYVGSKKYAMSDITNITNASS
jgi:flagellar basal-body rod modification protein FlgD